MSTDPPRPDAAEEASPRVGLATDPVGDVAPRRRPLASLLAANAVSLVGSQLTVLAILWFVLQTTGSAAKTGAAGATVAAAYVITAFIGGTLVDRLGFKRSSVLSDALGAIPVALVPFLEARGGLAFWQLLALVFVGTAATTPGGTARQSLLPDLAALAGTPLERANAAAQAVRTAASLAGPLLAGILIGTLGAGQVLWIDAATFVASAVAIGLLVPGGRTLDLSSGSYLADLSDGVRFIYRDRLVLVVTATGTGVNALAGALFTVILPVYAEHRFGSATAFGLMAAGDGGGALAGALLYGAVGHRLSRWPTYVGCFSLAGGAIAVLVGTPGLTVTVVVLAMMGMAIGPLNPLVITLFQERIPAAMRGRVFGAILAISNAAAPLGIIVAGYGVGAVGLRPMLAGIAALMGLVALAVLTTPAFREMDRPAPTLGDKER